MITRTVAVNWSFFNDDRRFVAPAEWRRRLSEDFGDTDPWSKLDDERFTFQPPF